MYIVLYSVLQVRDFRQECGFEQYILRSEGVLNFIAKLKWEILNIANCASLYGIHIQIANKYALIVQVR